MIEREKMIEAIRILLYSTVNKHRNKYGDIGLSDTEIEAVTRDILNIILPADAVVLTKEEYENLKNNQVDGWVQEELKNRAYIAEEKASQYLDAIGELTAKRCALRCPLVEQARKEMERGIRGWKNER